MNWCHSMWRDRAQWKSGVFRLLAVLVLFALLLQPETWHLALALDAAALDALALLVEVQVAVAMGFVFRQTLLPVARALWQRGLLPLWRCMCRDLAPSLAIIEGCVRQVRGIRRTALDMP